MNKEILGMLAAALLIGRGAISGYRRIAGFRGLSMRQHLILAVGAIVVAFATGARAAEATYQGTATLTDNQSFDGPYGLLPLGSTLDLTISINAPNGITPDTTLNAIGYGVTPLDSFSASIGNYQFGTPSDGGGYFVTSELQFYGNQYTGFSDNDGADNVSFTLFHFSIDTPIGVNAYNSSGLPLFHLATSGEAQIITYEGADLSFDLNVASFHRVPGRFGAPEIDPASAAGCRISCDWTPLIS